MVADVTYLVHLQLVAGGNQASPAEELAADAQRHLVLASSRSRLEWQVEQHPPRILEFPVPE